MLDPRPPAPVHRPVGIDGASIGQRQRDGVISVPVDVGPEVFELLVRTGWLAEEQAGDRRAIALAISRMLKESRGGGDRASRLPLKVGASPPRSCFNPEDSGHLSPSVPARRRRRRTGRG